MSSPRRVQTFTDNINMLERAKKVDLRTQKLIHGYARSIQTPENLTIINIPPLIILYIITVYYHDFETSNIPDFDAITHIYNRKIYSNGSVEHIRAKMFDIISFHESNTLFKFDDLMIEWKGKENDLYKHYCSKYSIKTQHNSNKKNILKAIKLKSVYSIGSKINKTSHNNRVTVRKCKNKKTGKLYAIKVIIKKKCTDAEYAFYGKQIMVLRTLRMHTNIVNLVDVFDSKSELCLVMDYMEGGELFDTIIEYGAMIERHAVKTFKGILNALQFIHSKKIAHRSITPESFSFKHKYDANANDETMNIVLHSFGLSGSCKNNKMKTSCGTPNYVSPEILRKEPYDTQCDMWSAGVVLYIILCGFPPFYDENDDMGRLYRRVKACDYDMPSPYWDNVSNEAKDLVRKLLVLDPKQRLTAREALEHPWLKMYK